MEDCGDVIMEGMDGVDDLMAVVGTVLSFPSTRSSSVILSAIVSDIVFNSLLALATASAPPTIFREVSLSTLVSPS